MLEKVETNVNWNTLIRLKEHSTDERGTEEEEEEEENSAERERRRIKLNQERQKHPTTKTSRFRRAISSTLFEVIELSSKPVSEEVQWCALAETNDRSNSWF